MVYNLDLDDVRCLRYSLSKVLGLGIVVGGSIVKVPQILKIVRAKSARGVSLGSYLLDTSSLLLVVGYNYRSAFPFSTYGQLSRAPSPEAEPLTPSVFHAGENVFLLVQNLVIISLILLLSHHPQALLLAVASLVASAAAIFALASSDFVSLSQLRTLFALSIPLALAAKLPQILQNHRRRSTGQLSAFLVINSLAGCLARVFTTATETGDHVIWWSFVGASALNGVLALQMLAFWSSTNEEAFSSAGTKRGLTSAGGKDRDESLPLQQTKTPAQLGLAGKGADQKSRAVSSSRPAKQYVRKAD